MSSNNTETFKAYRKEDGEPAAIRREAWNGELMKFNMQLLNQIAQERDHKKRFKLLGECVKIAHLVNEEFEKAGFYKDEFESMATYLDNIDCLHISQKTEKVMDERGKEHNHVFDIKRSIVKSIPTLRTKVKL